MNYPLPPLNSTVRIRRADGEFRDAIMVRSEASFPGRRTQRFIYLEGNDIAVLDAIMDDGFSVSEGKPAEIEYRSTVKSGKLTSDMLSFYRSLLTRKCSR